MEGIIKVGMADLRAANHPCVLTTLGLGSCVGIALYDKSTQVAGLAHVMLPSSIQARSNTNLAKFADTAIVKLVEEMEKLGANTRNITAKIAGGAEMFKFSQSTDILKIGQRNVEATLNCLKQLNIPVIAQDTGGSHGRTIELYSDDGRLIVKTIGYGTKQI